MWITKLTVFLYITINNWILKLLKTYHVLFSLKRLHSTKKKKKHLGINLIKDVQDLYAENYEMLVKEIKDQINRENTN